MDHRGAAIDSIKRPRFRGHPLACRAHAVLPLLVKPIHPAGPTPRSLVPVASTSSWCRPCTLCTATSFKKALVIWRTSAPTIMTLGLPSCAPVASRLPSAAEQAAASRTDRPQSCAPSSWRGAQPTGACCTIQILQTRHCFSAQFRNPSKMRSRPPSHPAFWPQKLVVCPSMLKCSCSRACMSKGCPPFSEVFAEHI